MKSGRQEITVNSFLSQEQIWAAGVGWATPTGIVHGGHLIPCEIFSLSS